MARIQFYQRGHPPQYGRVRWARYETLRVEGFSKSEARTLSVHHLGDPVIVRMISIRRAQVTRFTRMAERRGWSRRTALYHFRRAVRDWYTNHDFNTKGTMIMQKGQYVRVGGGKPSPYEWFRYVERRLAAQAGMSLDEYERQREKRETPISKKGQKGQVKAQKARARERKRAYRHHDIIAEGGQPRKVKLELLEKWLSDSIAYHRGRRLPPTVREWRRDLRARIRHAKEEQLAGRPAMG